MVGDRIDGDILDIEKADVDENLLRRIAPFMIDDRCVSAEVVECTALCPSDLSI